MSESTSSLGRALEILRIIGTTNPAGIRIKDLAAAAGCGQSTAHRALQELILAGFVEQESSGKRYRLALDFFVLAAQAGQANGLRELARPVLLRLSAMLNETVFLLVRYGFDAICLDRIEGSFPIRTFTGDIGGKVPLGLGQGSLAILGHLPEAEQDAVIAYNVPRLIERGFLDEAALRAALTKVREQGWSNLNTGLITGMAGVGVPIFDAAGHVVAALSIGTIAERLQPDRLATVISILKLEASKLKTHLNPFDPALRHPARSLSALDVKLQ